MMKLKMKQDVSGQLRFFSRTALKLAKAVKVNNSKIIKNN